MLTDKQVYNLLKSRDKNKFAKIMKTPQIYVFEEGEVYCSPENMSHGNLKSFSRKLGKFKHIKELKNKSVLDKYRITYRYYPHSRRARLFKRRKIIKDSLPKEYKKYASLARKFNKDFFLSKVAPDFRQFVKTIGYKNIEHFWRVNKYTKYDVPGHKGSGVDKKC
jgi:hypothetical protein